MGRPCGGGNVPGKILAVGLSVFLMSVWNSLDPGPMQVVEPELGELCCYDAHYPFSAHCLLVEDTPGVKRCLE